MYRRVLIFLIEVSIILGLHVLFWHSTIRYYDMYPSQLEPTNLPTVLHTNPVIVSCYYKHFSGHYYWDIATRVVLNISLYLETIEYYIHIRTTKACTSIGNNCLHRHHLTTTLQAEDANHPIPSQTVHLIIVSIFLLI